MTRSATRIGQALTTQKYSSIQQTGLTHSRYHSIKTFINWQNGKLFLQQCSRFCMLDSIMQDCGCFHPLYLDIDDTRLGHSVCNLANITTTACVGSILDQIVVGQRTCPCHQSCDQTLFQTSVSAASWPSKQYEVGK